MSLKKTTLLAAILAVLIGFYYLYEIRGGEKREQAKEAALMLFQVQESDISEITIEKPGEKKVRVARGVEGWAVKEPLEAEGDDDVMTSMTDALSSGEKDRVVEENPSDLGLYGLDEPAVEITFNAGSAGGGTLLIGDANPVGTGFYAKRADAPQVVLLPNWTKGRLDRTLYDVRDKTVLSIDYEGLRRIIIKGEEEVVAELEGPENWRLTSPISLPAELGKIRDLVNHMRGTKVHAFVEEEPADYSPYGLDKPAYKIAFQMEDEEEPETLYLGLDDKERGGIYARVGGRKNVFLLEESFLDGIPKSNAELRDRKLARVEYDKANRIQVETEGEMIMVEKGERNRWTMKEPFEARGDRRKIDSLIFGVKDLEAKEFVEDNPQDLSKYGLSPSKAKITIWEEGRDAPRTLLLGDQAETGKIYAKVGEEPTVFLADKGEVDQLPLRVEYLQNKRILSFETTEIVEVSIWYPEEELAIKKEEGKWVASKPERFEPLYWKVSDLLWYVHEFEFKKIASEGGAGPSDRRFDQVLAEIKLSRKDDETPIAATIGKKEGDDLTYAVVEGDERIYVVDPSFLDGLPKGKGDLM